MKWLFFLCPIVVYSTCRAQDAERDIVLVNVDTLDRQKIAKVIDKLNALNPSVISIDLQFSSLTDSASDEMLCRSLQKTKCLVMASVIDDYDGTKITYKNFVLGSLPMFFVNAKTGFANTRYENDSIPILRRFALFEDVNGKREYHLAVRTAMTFDSLKAARFINTHPKLIAVDFSDHSFRKISFKEILDGKLAHTDIRHKIVLIGFMGPGNSDKFFTPQAFMHSPYERDMYGLEYLACIVTQVLR
jgi:CHASE2 domain-containing sensor protein